MITLEKLKELKACSKGIDWFESQKEKQLDIICFNLIDDGHANWANWLVSELMTRRQRVELAIFAAEQVLPIFESAHPDDLRPRQAIEAAKKSLKNKIYTADAAASAAAYEAAYEAAKAANAAAYTVYAANAAAYAADAAASAAAYAAAKAAAYEAAEKEMQIKIIKYGIELLREE